MTTRPGPGNPGFVKARHDRGWYSQAALVNAFEWKARQLGINLSVSVRQVRRWESADPPWPTPDYQTVLEALFGLPLNVLGFTPPHAAAHTGAVHAVRAAEHTGWWRAIVDDLPDHLDRLVDMESRTTGVRSYQNAVVPGLLQTEAYATAVIRATAPALPGDAVQQRVALRMERQRRWNPDADRTAWYILDEAVLRRDLGRPELLREQLAHILTEASRRPALRIQVLPINSALVLPQSYVLYDMPAPQRRIVYLESVGDAICADTPGLVARYSIAYEGAQAAALAPADSLTYIAGRLAELWNPNATDTSDGESHRGPTTAATVSR